MPERTKKFLSDLIHFRHVNRICERIKIDRNQKRLKNTSFSLVSDNCNGGTVCHSCGQQFRSPFVNLYLSQSDFLKLSMDFKRYMGAELVFIESEDYLFPVAKLDDITIYFMHYTTEEEAREKWIERKNRINYENLFFMLTVDSRSVDLRLLEQFDGLEINKVILGKEKYGNLKSSIAIKHYSETENHYSNLSTWINEINGKKTIDDFDYVSWLNAGMKE